VELNNWNEYRVLQKRNQFGRKVFGDKSLHLHLHPLNGSAQNGDATIQHLSQMFRDKVEQYGM
jgi:hypothetical protein